MPGTAIGFPSGPAGRAGSRSGGMRLMIADLGRSSTGSSWNQSGETRSNVDGVPGYGAHFSSAKNQVRQRWLVTGTTKDNAGAALGACAVTLFRTVDNQPVATTVSSVAGYYEFTIDGNSATLFAVSYKTGAPDVAGTTVNTLVPVLT